MKYSFTMRTTIKYDSDSERRVCLCRMSNEDVVWLTGCGGWDGWLAGGMLNLL